MSGIVGIINTDGAPVDRDLLRRMTGFMARRGPDAQNVWADGAVGFGHAMLRATRESEAEEQPRGLGGNWWVTADARLDARTELTGKLEAAGFAGLDKAADADLILCAYAAWGEDCVEHLLGDFSFAIWDAPRRRLFCARDHFGVKPFYYAEVEGALVFGNTLNCLRRHPQVSAELNDLAVGDFLLFGYNQEPDTTTFADIRRLPPAHRLTWSQGRRRVSRYWTLPADGCIRYREGRDYVEHFKVLWRAAVGDRLRASRVAVSMSGGLDSPSIAATAKALLSERSEAYDLRAFTMVYDRLIPDVERPYAATAAEGIGIPIEFHVLDDYKLFERWDEPGPHQTEPNWFPLTALITDHLTRVAAHSRAMLSGDGGDALQLFSYTDFKRRMTRLRLGGVLACMLRHYRTCGRLPALGFRTLLRDVVGRRVESKHLYPGWLNHSFATAYGLPARLELLNAPPPRVHHARPEAYDQMSDIYWTEGFERADPGATGVPVEPRYPFFDRRLVEYMLAIPPMPWFAHKGILREAMKGVLAEPIRTRRKARLAGDAVLELLRNGGADEVTNPEVVPALHKYVNVEALRRPSAEETAEQLWLKIRPLSLNYWLLSSRLTESEIPLEVPA